MSWSESQKRRRIATAKTKQKSSVIVPRSFRTNVVPDLIKIMLGCLPTREILVNCKRVCQQWRDLANSCVVRLKIVGRRFERSMFSKLDKLFPKLVDITFYDASLIAYSQSRCMELSRVFFPRLKHFRQVGHGYINREIWNAIWMSKNTTCMLHFEECAPLSRFYSNRYNHQLGTMTMFLSHLMSKALDPQNFPNVTTLCIVDATQRQETWDQCWGQYLDQVGSCLEKWSKATQLNYLILSTKAKCVFDEHFSDQLLKIFGTWSNTTTITRLELSVDFYLQMAPPFIMRLKQIFPSLGFLDLAWTNHLKFPSAKGTNNLCVKMWNAFQLKVSVQLYTNARANQCFEKGIVL